MSSGSYSWRRDLTPVAVEKPWDLSGDCNWSKCELIWCFVEANLLSLLKCYSCSLKNAPLFSPLKLKSEVAFSCWFYYAYVIWCLVSPVNLFSWKLFANPSANCVNSASFLYSLVSSWEAVKLLASTEKILRPLTWVELQFPAKSSTGTTYWEDAKAIASVAFGS